MEAGSGRGGAPSGVKTRVGQGLRQRISTNSALSLVNAVASLVSGLLLVPLMLRGLGDVHFGLNALAGSIASYVGLLDLGLNVTLIRVVAARAEPTADGRPADLTATISSIFALYLGLGVAGGLVVLAVGLPAINPFQVAAADRSLFAMTLAIVALQTALTLPFSVWNAVLFGMQALPTVYVISIVQTVVRFVLVWVMLQRGFGLLALTVVNFSTTAITWAGNWWAVRRMHPDVRLDLGRIDWSFLRSIWHVSLSMIVWSLAGYALHSGDRLLLASVAPPATLTLYDLGAKLALYSRAVVQGALDTLLPHSAALGGRRDEAAIRRSYVQGTRWVLAAYGLVATVAMVAGGPFLDLWVGSGREQSAQVLLLLVGANLYQAQNLTGHVMLVGLGRLRAFTLVMGAYPLLIVGLGLWAGSTSATPAVAIAGAVLTTVVLLETSLLIILTRTFEVPLGWLFRHCHAPVAAAFAAGLLTGVGVRDLAATPVYRLFLAGSGAAIAYVAVFLLLCPWSTLVDDLEGLEVPDAT